MAGVGVAYKAEDEPPIERDVPTPVPRSSGGGKRKRPKEGEGDGERVASEEHVRMRIQPSPAPFSRYQTSVGHEEHEGRSRLPAGLTTADIKPPAAPGQGPTLHRGEEEQESAGCCKCVIM